jgi:hypothetical protein
LPVRLAPVGKTFVDAVLASTAVLTNLHFTPQSLSIHRLLST